MRVSEAIVGRQSIRAFLSHRPVSDEQIETLLTIAGRAPSGSNIQPWHAYIVRGGRKDRITEACSARYLSGDEGAYEYHYYPREWREPYIGRRRQTGFGLYGLLGIERHDAQAVKNYRVQNYQFFGAPVALFLPSIAIWSRGAGSITGCFCNPLCWRPGKWAWRPAHRRRFAPTTTV